MLKYRTEVRPWSALRKGDLIGTSYGFAVLDHVEYEADNRVTIYCTTQKPTTYHASNWPVVAVDYSDEYKAAYPKEVF